MQQRYLPKTFTAGNVKGVAFYVMETMRKLVHAKESVMDATFGTNSSGMELYAVLAELDGTRVPLAYMFVDKGQRANHASERADSYEMLDLL